MPEVKRNKSYRILPWLIIAMAFIATALSFLDRQVLSVIILDIKKNIEISDVQYGFINSCFLASYAIMFTLGGIMIDRYGSRIGLAISVGIWSLATLMHSVANTVYHFGIFRFLLGAGEGAAFPGAIKTVVEWIPKRMQGLANGIAIGGSALGAVIAPPLSVALLFSIGWRGVFLVTGGIGLAWVIAWMLIHRSTAKKPSQPKTEAQAKVKKGISRKEIVRLLKTRETWVFIVMRFLLDPVFYFFMFWIPKYLSDEKDLSISAIGGIFWIPFLALGISNIFGGFFSDRIYRKTGRLNFARKLVMGIAATLFLPVLFIQLTPTAGWAIFLMCLAFFAHGLWITNYITSISDVFGSKVTSTVVGLSGSAGAISAFIINPIIGLVIEKFSYGPMWYYSGVMYLVVFLLFTVLIPRIKLLEFFS